MEQYINAFSNLAKQNNSMLIPTNPADISSIVAQISAISNCIKNNN